MAKSASRGVARRDDVGRFMEAYNTRFTKGVLGLLERRRNDGDSSVGGGGGVDGAKQNPRTE